MGMEVSKKGMGDPHVLTSEKAGLHQSGHVQELAGHGELTPRPLARRRSQRCPSRPPRRLRCAPSAVTLAARPVRRAVTAPRTSTSSRTDDGVAVNVQLGAATTGVHGVTCSGSTALHLVASRGHAGLVRRVSDLVPSLLATRDGGLDTPLHRAAKAGHHEVAACLLSAMRAGGANVDALRARNGFGTTALYEAVRNGHAETVVLLATEAPELAAVTKDDGVSPLYLAAMAGSVEMVRALLRPAPDGTPSLASFAGPEGRTALHAAASKSKGRVMQRLLVFLLLVAAATASPTVESGTHSFQRWMAVHGRSYSTAEELQYRRGVYEHNMKRIADFNAQQRRARESAAADRRTYVLGPGPFTDLTEDEFVQLATTRTRVFAVSSRLGHTDTHVVTTAADDVFVPSSVDWREAGAVTPVKQQGLCGSCWAFAAVAAIESLHKIQSGELLSLSVQQLIDCSAGESGCVGWFPSKAFEWIVANGGIAAEDSYPYTGTRGVCDPTSAVRLSGYSFVESYNEKTLMSVVAKQPVVVSITISHGSNIQDYKGGVYDGPCIIGPADHDLTLVGYGQDQDGNAYWIGKNSWGPEWGDGGYIYIKKDVEMQPWGLCGVALEPMYPVI